MLKYRNLLWVAALCAAAVIALVVLLWRDRQLDRAVHEVAGDASGAERRAVPIGDSPQDGPADALVTVVEFADFGCRYCARSAVVRQRLKARYGDRIRWVFKNYSGRRAVARMALAAGAQGRFWAFADAVFERRASSPEALRRMAISAGIDRVRLERALKDTQAYDQVIDADLALGRELGVDGTPSFFINGRRLRGYYPLPYLDRVILQEMVHARDWLARGVPRSQLYQRISTGARPTSRPTPKASEAKRGAAKRGAAKRGAVESHAGGDRHVAHGVVR